MLALLTSRAMKRWPLRRPGTTSVTPIRCIEKPQLVFHNGVNSALGAYGVFWPGENIIFVRANMPGDDLEKRMNTTVHELTHYLQDQMGYQRVDSCDWEAGAFAVGDRYAVYIGRPDLVRGATWWKPYRQCQNYGG